MPQKRLAEQVTLLVHGEEGLQQAKQASEVMYDRSVSTLGKMKAEEMMHLFHGSSVVEILPEAGQTMLDLAMKVGCFSTNRMYSSSLF